MPGSRGNLIYHYVITIISNLLGNHGQDLDLSVPQFGHLSLFLSVKPKMKKLSCFTGLLRNTPKNT